MREIKNKRKVLYNERNPYRRCRRAVSYTHLDIDVNVTTEFVGYDHLTFDSKVTVFTTETEIVNSLMEGQKGTVFTEQTPFYATMGGQVGDTGVIETANGKFVVEDTIKMCIRDRVPTTPISSSLTKDFA